MAGQEHRHEHDRHAMDGAPRDDGDACRTIVLPEECRDPDTPGEDAEFAHPADVADHLENLSLERQVCMLRHLPAEDAAEALAELDEHVRVDLLENLDADVAAQILSEMSPDDAADVLDELDEDHRDVLLSSLETEDAEEIRHLMAFDPDTAGGVMNTEIIILDHGLTADQAISQIRAEIEDKIGRASCRERV
mgnify:FL=1